jgi:hypothetical protein
MIADLFEDALTLGQVQCDFGGINDQKFHLGRWCSRHDA